jgi:hypothetical protein
LTASARRPHRRPGSRFLLFRFRSRAGMTNGAEPGVFRYPDLRKVILQQQAQNVLCILAIGLLLAFPLPGDLRGVSDPQLAVPFR